jgi:hypothetical protein
MWQTGKNNRNAAITSSPTRRPGIWKRWLMAISNRTVANVTVARTYWSEFCRPLVPCSKASKARSFSLAAASALELRYSGINSGPAGALMLLTGSIFFQFSKAGRNSGRKRLSKRSASFLSPWASAFSHSTKRYTNAHGWRMWWPPRLQPVVCWLHCTTLPDVQSRARPDHRSRQWR